MAATHARKSGIGKVIIVFALSFFVFFSLIYAGISIYYEQHYFPHTTIAGVECGNKTPDYVQQKLQDNAGHYSLTIHDRTGQISAVDGSDIRCGYVTLGEEEKILKEQSGFRWPGQLSGDKKYELQYSIVFDENLLERTVSAFSFMEPLRMEVPVNAAFTMTGTGYDLIPEVQGTTVIREQVFSEISTAVKGQEQEVTLSDDCYLKPDITTESPEIVKLTSQFDRYLSSTVTYDIEGREEILDSEKIASMLLVSEDDIISVDEKKVAAYVQSLASKYNTYGRRREFRTSKGDTITIGGGDYGWVVAKAREAEQLLLDLEGGVPVTREPVYEQTALYRGEDDIGTTYVEIDYTNQHLYYYKDGTILIDTDIVSGNINRGNGSPDGVFKIVYKKSPATLVGENYESDVTYFMPFAYNVGIHDAGWRSEFGADIYQTNGSHGCVNVPKEAAEKLYEAVATGTPVVAYYREEVKLTAENTRISNAYSYAGD